jgi:hypothetical protein
VSLRIAQRLYGIGFEVICDSWFDTDGNVHYGTIMNTQEKKLYSRPTIDIALKWLRVNYDICIHCWRTKRYEWVFEISVVKPNDDVDMEYASREQYTSYEEAILNGLDYYLNNVIQ